MDPKTESVLDSVYYGREGEPGAFLSQNGLYKAAKRKLPALRLATVQEWLNKQQVYLQRKEPPKRQLKGSQRYFTISKPNYELIVDAAYIARYKSPQKFMVLGVDGFSKMIYTGFIRNLTAASVARIVEKWLKDRNYKIILTDNGSEFKGKDFNEMLEKYKAKHIYSSPKWANKTSLAEIYIRRWKEMLSKILASKRESSVLRAFNLATQMLNSNPKTETDMTPSEMEADVGKALYKKMYKKWSRADKYGPWKPPKFKLNDKVYLRKATKDKTFKSGDSLVETKPYKIIEVLPTQPKASYKLRLVDFPYSVLSHSFSEAQLVSYGVL